MNTSARSRVTEHSPRLIVETVSVEYTTSSSASGRLGIRSRRVIQAHPTTARTQASIA